MICSMMGTVLLTGEVYLRLASLKGFSTPSPPKWTGSASLSLSKWPHCRSVMEGMRLEHVELSSLKCLAEF